MENSSHLPVSEQRRVEIQKEVLNLLAPLADVQDTLATIAEKNLQNDRSDLEALRLLSEAFCSFNEEQPQSIVTSPRRISDKDRQHILPGQHGGVYIIITLPDSTQVKINFYGGLRTVSGPDLRDSDTTLVNIHSSRTDRILMQPVFFNWQMTYPGGGPELESWIRYSPENGRTFIQDAVMVDRQKFDIHPVISPDAYNYEVMASGLFRAVNKLTTLVSSSV